MKRAFPHPGPFTCAADRLRAGDQFRRALNSRHGAKERGKESYRAWNAPEKRNARYVRRIARAVDAPRAVIAGAAVDAGPRVVSCPHDRPRDVGAGDAHKPVLSSFWARPGSAEALEDEIVRDERII